MITTDNKANGLVGRITQWRTQNGKSTQGLENDAVVTPLTGATPDYISFVLRTLGQGSGTMSMGGMGRGGMAGRGMMGGMSGGMMGGGMMGGGMMGGMSGGMTTTTTYSSGGMMGGGMMGGGMMGGGMMGGFHAQLNSPNEGESEFEDLNKPQENNKVETMQNFVSGFY